MTEQPVLHGESIVVVTHPAFVAAAQKAHPQLVVYTADEVRELRWHRDEPDYAQIVRMAHELKRRFDGVVLPRARGRHPKAVPEREKAPSPIRSEPATEASCWWTATGDTEG